MEQNNDSFGSKIGAVLVAAGSAIGLGMTRPYSEKTAELIDKEVKALIQMIHDKTKTILTENSEGFMQLAALLLEKEVIFADDLERIFGPRAGAKTSEEN